MFSKISEGNQSNRQLQFVPPHLHHDSETSTQPYPPSPFPLDLHNGSMAMAAIIQGYGFRGSDSEEAGQHQEW